MAARGEQTGGVPLNDDERRAVLDLLDETMRAAGIFLASEIRDGAIILSGEVIEPGDHQAALDIAEAVATPRGLKVEDAIEDMDEESTASFEDMGGEEVDALDQDEQRPSIVTGPTGVLEVDPDFSGDVGTTDYERAVEDGLTYFPPVDPVIAVEDDRRATETLEVVGGFAEDATDEDDDPATVFPSIDDDLAEAVMRELEQDAATADLTPSLRVIARGGTVILRGVVDTVEDAENAEAVAARVDGVDEVREELQVVILPHPEDPDESAQG